MKFNKIAKKFAAAALAGVLAVSTMGISASAAGDVSNSTGITSVSVGKTITTDGNTYKPATNFTFKVELGEAEESFYDGTQNVVVYKGVDRGLTYSAAASSSPATDDELSTTYTISGGELAVDASVFTAPGVYHYVVSEVDGEYEGITYDTTSYDVYLYVYNNTSGTGYYVGNVVVTKTTEVEGVSTTSKADLVFTNDYDSSNTNLHDITVTKNVTGDMADMSKTFDFNVSVDGASGEIYKVVYSVDGTEATTQTTYVVGGETAKTISIKSNGYITVYSLSATDKVTIYETDYTSDGYTTTYTNDAVKDGTTLSQDTSITVTNTKSATTPTGIALSIAPYVLMVAFAGVIAVLFLRKRNYEI